MSIRRSTRSTRPPTQPLSPPPSSSSSSPSPEFSTYPIDQLLLLWKQGELTVDQLAGHLLQHVRAHEQRLRRLELR